MLLSRSKPPLWVAVLVAPLFYNALAIAIAGIGYVAIGRPALVSVLVVWIASAARLLLVVDSYEIGESRRALAVVGAVFWLAASFVILALVAYGIGRL
jgi:hypothetical protein